jgi:hypothetical protein
MAIRSGQKKINPESDRGAERKRPLSSPVSADAFKMQFRIAEEKAYCGEAAR